jgi:hypothetical protein
LIFPFLFVMLFYILSFSWLNKTTNTNMCSLRFRGFDIGMNKNANCTKINIKIFFFSLPLHISQRSAHSYCRNIHIHDRSTLHNDTSQRDGWMDFTNQICSKTRRRVSENSNSYANWTIFWLKHSNFSTI